MSERVTVEVISADFDDGMYVARALCNGASADGHVSGNRIVSIKSAVESLLSSAAGMIAVWLAVQGQTPTDAFGEIEAELSAEKES